jgi:F-type H+-transporting ATPase subunit b
MTIDWWTFGFQTVNVVVLVWLLERFFWRPVAAMIARRRDTTREALADAEATNGKATAALADIEQTRAGFGKERDAILAAAHDSAEKSHIARMADTEKEMTALKNTATAAIEKEQQAAEKRWTRHASGLAVDIANRLAVRLEGQAVRAAFLDWLIKAIAALPEPQRNAVTALEAISATPLEQAEQEHASVRIAEAFGGHPSIAFKTDGALIAGLELHGPHLLISNSWRADLTRILTDITHDK